MTDHAQRNFAGMQCVTRGEYADAIQHFHAAITAADHIADYHANLGLALLLSEHAPHEAIVAFQAALQRNHFLPVVWGYLGAAYCAIGDDAMALRFLLRGLAEPSAFVLRHLCLVHARNGLYYETKFYAEALLALHPDDVPAHFNRSLMLLATGAFAEGWAEFEWRTQMEEVKHHCIPVECGIPNAQPWQGEDIRDKHLLLHAEAGIGDSIQFCRFIPDLAARCRYLSVYERPGLRRLLRAAYASDTVNICDTVPQDVDVYLRMMGSGRILRLHHGNLDRGAYLPAPLAQAWQARLAHLPQPRVGLVWAGQGGTAVDARRSLRLADIAPLTALPAGWVSLQMHRIEPVCPMFDAAPFITDWYDTAGAIDALDLVITVDTAVAHLAGAMGKPVWLLNRFDTCWRWGITGERTSWYHSMRMFRQPRIGDWASVLLNVAEALKNYNK